MCIYTYIHHAIYAHEYAHTHTICQYIVMSIFVYIYTYFLYTHTHTHPYTCVYIFKNTTHWGEPASTSAGHGPSSWPGRGGAGRGRGGPRSRVEGAGGETVNSWAWDQGRLARPSARRRCLLEVSGSGVAGAPISHLLAPPPPQPR